MNSFSIISLVLSVPTFFLVSLSQISLWQRKEYRVDRILAVRHDIYYSAKHLIYILIPLLWLIAWLANDSTLATLSLAVLSALYLLRVRRLGISRPDWTTKATVIYLLICVYVILLLPFISISSTDLPIKLTAIILLIYPLTPTIVNLVNFAANIKKGAVISRAKALRQKYHSSAVIGVTGSVGKTTTKHFLSQLIPDAISSRDHRNSDYVIALDLIEQLNSQTKHYIVEMSAYRSGEIASIADLTRPSVGIITTIGKQHLSLFGSQAKILNAKWELIDSLPPDGTAVLNADSPLLQQKATNYPGRIIWFSTQQSADIYADQINLQPDRLHFTLHIKQNQYSIVVNLLSEAYLNSILAAVAAAHASGVPDNVIVQNLSQLKPYPRTMELRRGINQSHLIDDSYSASEKSVLNAIQHLNRFPQSDKRIIMVPLIELGSSSNDIHTKIGRALNNSSAKVFIYGAAHHQQLKQPFFTDPKKLLKLVTHNLSSDTVILLEGRLPEIIHTSLLG